MLLANSLAKSSRAFLLSWFPSLSESSDSSQELNGTHFFASSKLHYPNPVLALAVVIVLYMYQYQCSNQRYSQSNQIPLRRWWWWWLGWNSILHIKAKAKQAWAPSDWEYLVKLAVNGWVIAGQCLFSERVVSFTPSCIVETGGSCICCLASQSPPACPVSVNRDIWYLTILF